MRTSFKKTGVRAVAALALALLTTQAQAQPARPAGELKLPAGELQVAQTLLDQDKYDHALQSLKAFKSTDTYQRMWAHYLRGLAHFGLEQHDAGLKEFIVPYDHISAPGGTRPSQEEFRLAAMALKKVGWYYRHKKEYMLAFAYHSIGHQYAQGYGSNFEMHDAAISLDVDAYFLEDPNLSEMWLQKSIVSAEGIADSTQKAKALATSFNNLSGTYTTMNRFEEAEQLAQLSMGQWEEFEARTDKSGNRAIWAYFTLGDVYQSWAGTLKEDPEKFGEVKGKAYSAFQSGKKLGEAAGMSAGEINSFAERLEQLEALSPRE